MKLAFLSCYGMIDQGRSKKFCHCVKIRFPQVRISSRKLNNLKSSCLIFEKKRVNQSALRTVSCILSEAVSKVQARRIHRIVWATINYCLHPDESKQSFAVDCTLSLHARSNECLDCVLSDTSAICRNYVPCIYYTRSKRNVFLTFIYFPLINPIERSYPQHELSKAIFSYNTRDIYREAFYDKRSNKRTFAKHYIYVCISIRTYIFILKFFFKIAILLSYHPP